MAILFVSGVNDLSTIGLQTDAEGNVIHLMDGNCSVHRRIPLKEGMDGFVVLFGKGVKQRMFNFAETPTLIFNQIADADTHRGSLERCAELCEQLSSVVINQPQKVMRTTRDRVFELLKGIPGVKMPRTLRFQPSSPDGVFQFAEAAKIDFPFIVRIVGDHAGKSMVLVRSLEDLALLHVFPFDGRDYYLTEYVDYKDDDGFYHKQRFIVIDGEPVLRHSLYNSDWKIHGSSRQFMLDRESWEEDQKRCEWLETEMIPKLGPAFKEIKDRLGLEYFGVDCNINRDGEVLIFEANANMNILTNKYPELNDRLEMIHQKIYALLTRFSGEAVI